MTQKNIDFGTFPDDPAADAIRTAFQKVQQNFTELYTTTLSGAVSTVNRTQGAGITVNNPTGNVIVTANIACVQVSTSTLSIGRDGNGGTSALITQSSQVLVIDLPETISTGGINLTDNANIAGTANVGNLISIGNVVAGNVNTIGTANVGILTVTGNANVGNIGSSGVVISSGNVSGANVISSGYMIHSVNPAMTAAGSTQGTATVIANDMNIIATANVGEGVVLPIAVAGMMLTVTNTTANTVKVYPSLGAQINLLGSDIPVEQVSNLTLQYIAPVSGQWYTVGTI